MRLRERVYVILVFSDILVLAISHCILHTLLPFNGKREIERERERERVVEILYYFHNFHLNLKKNKKTKCKIFDKVPTVTIKMCLERQKQR